MRDAEHSRSHTPSFYIAAGATVVGDQLTKLLARACLPSDGAVTVIPGFFDLKLSFNTGAAFGMLPYWAPLFIIAALAMIFAIVKFRAAGEGSRPLRVGLGLLLGGAIGNLIDRLASSAHEVTDFLSLYIRSGGKAYAWPTFNLADAAIVVGAIMVFYHVYVIQKRQ